MKRRAPQKISARMLAARALNQFISAQGRNAHSRTGVYVADLLDGLITATDQKPRATDLVLGTIRNLRAIDLVLGSIAETPTKRISPVLINVVRVGIYELVYHPQTPEYSVINDAAEITKSFAAQRQVGFVNAVLRKVASRIQNRSTAISSDNIRAILPSANGTGCLFNRCLLPDPERNPADYFTAAYSIPRWLILELLKQYGLEKTKQICVGSNRRSSVYLRPNTLKTTAYALAELLSTARIRFEFTADEQMIKLRRSGNITELPGFDDGLFTVQDLAAAQVVPALKPHSGSAILDLCAAPGTKTTQLAELTADKAEIFATDIDPVRLEKVRQNIKRLGVDSITVVNYDNIAALTQHKDLFKEGLFDAVLVDVPCSNTGVLAKRPEVRLRITQSAVENLAQTQAELLKTAAGLVDSGGKICYSTCSVLKQENERQVKGFLGQSPQFRLVTEELILPSAEADHDGAYFAILKKS
jgi:16S rRNA (cytosine967-C5)-methyltransferase